MTVELEISELDDYSKCVEYINSKDTFVTSKMLIRDCKVVPKLAHRILRHHEHAMLANPHDFGSNKSINRNLYKKVSVDEMKSICENELKNLKKNKNVSDDRINNYINSGLSQLLYNKYRLNVPHEVLKSL